MARPRLSDEHHALQGTAYKYRGKTMSKLTAGKPKMPTHLSAEARREWKRVMPFLLERGSLTEADATALSLHVEVHSRWLQAKKDVEQRGLMVDVTVLDSNGQPVVTRKVNQSLKIAQDCERALRVSLRELGLTPATRERVLPAKPEEKEQQSAIAKILKAVEARKNVGT